MFDNLSNFMKIVTPRKLKKGGAVSIVPPSSELAFFAMHRIVEGKKAFFTDLYNLNVFKNLKGLIIGRAYRQSDGNLEKIKNIFLRYTENTKYPILYGVDVGHTTPMITIPFWGQVEMNSRENKFIIYG